MTILNNKQTELLHKIIEEAGLIFIVAHKNPDGDALGSTLGLYHILRNKGKKVKVILPNAFAATFDWMPEVDNIIIYEKQKNKAIDALEKADLVCCLDFNSLSRIEELGEHPAMTKKPILMLDHHPQPDDFAEYRWSDVNASSTCEIVYNFAEHMGYLDFIDKNAASCLYTGLVTDTGSFRFSATTSRTLHIGAFFMEKGVDHVSIQEYIFSGNKLSKLQLWGFALYQKLNFIEKFATAYISITKEELAKFNFEEGDLEGLVNYALSVKGAKLGILMTEKHDKIRMSFRSKNGFSANDFARKYFNGGGHEMAAGGTSFESMDKTIEKLLTSLEEFQQ